MIKPTAKSSFIAPLILFCVSPLLFLPYVIKGMRRGEKWAFLLFALFLGLWAWLTIPFADLFRHAQHYFDYEGEPYAVIFNDYFVDNDTVAYDLIVPTLDWLMVNHGVPFQVLRFFEATMGFLLICSVLDYMLKNSKVVYSKADVWHRFLIMGLFMELMLLILGVRFGFATCLYVYGLHCWYNKRNILQGIMFLLLALGFHMSFSVLVPLSLVVTFVLRSKKSVILILFVATPILSYLLFEFSDLIGVRAEWYLGNGEDLSGNGYKNVTFIGLIVTLIWRLPTLFFGYIAWKNFDKPLPWLRTALVWAILMICLSSNSVLFLRMSWLLGAVGVFALLNLEYTEKLSERTIKIAIIAGVITTFGGGIYHKTALAYSHYEFLVRPIPMIYEHQYSKAWMYYHIDNNDIIRDTRGDFVK